MESLDQESSRQLDPSQIEPLLLALDDMSRAVAQAALHALVRLPLDQVAWLQVSQKVIALLDLPPEGDTFAEQTLGGIPYCDVIEVAAFVPVVSVRNRLYGLLASPDPSERWAVAEALARRRDSRAVPTLLGALADPDQTARERVAELLSLLDVSQRLSQVQVAFERERDSDVRFWLSLALARQGRSDSLEKVIQELASGKLDLRAASGDPAVLADKIGQRGPFPGKVHDAFQRIRPEDRPWVLSTLLHAGEVTPAPPSPVVPAPDPARSAQAVALVQELMQPSRSASSGLDESDIEILRWLPVGKAAELVSHLVAQAAASPAPFANLPVELVAGLYEPFAPDVTALHAAFRRAAEKPLLRLQIAWIASRAGLAGLVSGLASAFDSPDEIERLAACQLVEEAIHRGTLTYPPLLGMGGPESGMPAIASEPDVLIQDGHAEMVVLDDLASPIVPVESYQVDGAKGLKPKGPKPKGPKPKERQTLPAARRRRVVNTGFSPHDRPDRSSRRNMPLQRAQDYWFWLDIGEPARDSIATTRAEISEDVPAGALIRVVLFSFQDELQITRGNDIGLLKILSDGQVVVETQPLGSEAPSSRKDKQRLFFPVRTPDRTGTFRLRCNIYWGQFLLQSWLVTARVMARPRLLSRPMRALASRLDYNLASLRDLRSLNVMPEHRLSLLLNKNENGTHSMHFYGADGKLQVKQDDVRFGEGELNDMIEQGRGTLRLAAWEKTEEWQPGVPFRYQNQPRDLKRLESDLANLAIWGYGFYDRIIARLAGGEDAVDDLEKLLRTPGLIQIAMKESPSYVLPAALIYDAPLDTGAASYTFCPVFEQALAQNQPLENTACFQGNCPSHGKDTVICPSGFWGYRHALGMPLTLPQGTNLVAEITYRGNLGLVVGYAKDLTLFGEHAGQLQSLAQLTWNASYVRDQLFECMKNNHPHIVYFYCHGGLVRNMPFLQIGSKDNPGRIQSSNLRAKRIVWDAPRPLVFINGCHTTAVQPQQALEFISPLVSYSRSAGVIGTEITIYEELARDFANECFRRFFAGQPIGQAIRGARLKLLADGNPLGLVYIPFVQAGLKLVQK